MLGATPFFADLKPRHTGQSKMTAGQATAQRDIGADTSTIRPLNLDNRDMDRQESNPDREASRQLAFEH